MGNLYTYNKIILLRNETQIWEMVGNFSQQFIIGAFLAGSYAFYLLKDNNLKLKALETKGQLHTLDDLTNMYDISVYNININQIDMFTTCSHIYDPKLTVDPEVYFIWLRNKDKGSLYKFTGNEFIQGILTFLNAFNIDYREFILTAPVKLYFYNSIIKIRQYSIVDYPLTILQYQNPICEQVLNQGVIPRMDERLTKIRSDMERSHLNIYKPNDLSKESYIDRIMSEIRIAFIYTDPKDDQLITQRLIQYRGAKNIGNPPDAIAVNNFLRSKGYL